MKMGRTFKLAVVLLGGLSLGACSVVESVEETVSSVFDSSGPSANKTPSEVTRDFAAPEAPMDYALFEAYMDLAEARYYAGEEGDFEYFADRAISVASGADVSPAIIDPNLMSDSQADELKDTRKRLVEAQAEALGRAYNPDRVTLLRTSARAQVLFDCRLRQIHLDRGSDETSACGDRFSTSLAALETALKSGAGADELESIYVIYFDEDSTDLDIMARAVIAEAEAAARKAKGARFIVVGGAGRARTAAGNALSALRAEAVARELEAGGLPVKIDAHGPQAQLIPAGGDDPEINRRVEIKIER